MSDLYDVKISVRSSVKLLPEIKGLLSMKPNRKKLFRDTVFGPWLDIQSYENDSHMMHYAFQHQMSNPNVALISSPEVMSQAWFKDSAEFIKGLDAQDGTFLQDDQGREKGMEQHNGMCGDTEDGTFVDRVVGKIYPKMNRMSVDDGDGVLDYQSDDEDGVLDSQTKDVIEEAPMLPTMSSNNPQAGNAAASSSSAHPRNDEDVSHLDDNMEIDGPNAKDRYSNSQHHFYLLIKALGTKIENPSIDSVVVVPPKVDDLMLHTIKPKDDFDEADVDSYDDDYMSLFNDEE
nr:phospholipase-like protein [Tanacetum cinerariifolium]